MSAASGCSCGRLAEKQRRVREEACEVLPLYRRGHVAVRLDSDTIILFGGLLDHKSICLCIVWSYNIDTQSWRKHDMKKEQTVPFPRFNACAVQMGGAVYMHGGSGSHVARETASDQWFFSSALWRLSKSTDDVFCWREVIFPGRACVPSPRAAHTAWQHGNSMYMFGGYGSKPDGHLHEHGSFVGELMPMNNQLLRYIPGTHEWIDVRCAGAVPIHGGAMPRV